MTQNYIEAQFDVLKRITSVGCSYALKKKSSRFLDIFQHLEDEIERTRLACIANNKSGEENKKEYIDMLFNESRGEQNGF